MTAESLARHEEVIVKTAARPGQGADDFGGAPPQQAFLLLAGTPAQTRAPAEAAAELAGRLVQTQRKDGFWKSDDLLAVIESQVHWGWADLYASFKRGYPDRDQMGKMDLQRLQIRSSTPDTAVALCWMWVLLARHPEIEQRLVAELAEQVAGDRPSADEIGRLKYGQMVLDETLRLYPPADPLPQSCLTATACQGAKLGRDGMARRAAMSVSSILVSSSRARNILSRTCSEAAAW